MVGAVDERDLHVNHGVAGNDAALEGFLCALLNRVDVFLGDGAAISNRLTLGQDWTRSSAGLAAVFTPNAAATG